MPEKRGASGRHLGLRNERRLHGQGFGTCELEGAGPLLAAFGLVVRELADVAGPDADQIPFGDGLPEAAHSHVGGSIRGYYRPDLILVEPGEAADLAELQIGRASCRE